MPTAASASASSSSSVPKEWIATWKLFDDRDTGFVTTVDFKHIMRSLGRRYTEAEFKDTFQTLPDPVPFHAFVQLMRQPYHGPTEEDLVTALQAFDANETGLLKLNELITLLVSLGEKMPEGEVRQLLSEVPVDERGNIRIDDLAGFLCTPVPTMTTEMVDLQRQLAQEAGEERGNATSLAESSTAGASTVAGQTKVGLD